MPPKRDIYVNIMDPVEKQDNNNNNNNQKTGDDVKNVYGLNFFIMCHRIRW